MKPAAKKASRIAAPALALLLLVGAARAQTPKATNIAGLLTADSLASGAWKDVLTSFFQLSFDKLTGPKRELNFQSNPFAVLLKNHPDAAIDTNYHKYRRLRKINFGFGLNLDSGYRFNGFSSGVRYALINKRDTTTSRLLFRELGNDSLSLEIFALQKKLNRYIDSVLPNTPANFEQRRKFFNGVTTLFSDRTTTFAQLDTAFQRMVKEGANAVGAHRVARLLAKNPQANLPKEADVHFSDLKKELQNALLWTVSIADTTYKDQFFFSNILLKTELLKGMGRYRQGANWELNLQAGINFVDDTLRKGRDLRRSLFRFEPGVNLVFRNKTADQSFFEVRFSGSYGHNFGSLYAGERRDSLGVNATLRVRLIGDVWIPLEIKYDPQSGNVFGWLNVRFNFNGQGKKAVPAS